MDISSILSEICMINKNYHSKSWTPPKTIICNDFTIDCISTYSSDIFPRLTKYNSKYYIIWDECYWYIFDAYIECFIAMNHGIEIDDDDTQTYAINKLICILSYYIAISFLKIDLRISAFFASIYYQLKEKASATFDCDTSTQLDLYKQIARILCLQHEIAHYAFKKKEIDESRIDFYIKILKVTNGLNRYFFYPLESYPHSAKQARLLINKHLNGKLKEEISCDISAFFSCITNYDRYFSRDKETPFSKKCAKLYEVFLIMDSLQFQASNVKNAWRNMYLNIVDEESIEKMYKRVEFNNYSRFSLKELFIRMEIEMGLLKRHSELQLTLLLEGEHIEKIHDMVLSAMFSKEFLKDYTSGSRLFSIHNRDDKIRIIKYLLGWEKKL